MKRLSFNLAKEYVHKRIETNSKLKRSVRLAAVEVGFIQPPAVNRHLSSDPVQTPRRCYVCRKSTRSVCDQCPKPVCGTHRFLTNNVLCGDFVHHFLRMSRMCLLNFSIFEKEYNSFSFFIPSVFHQNLVNIRGAFFITLGYMQAIHACINSLNRE